MQEEHTTMAIAYDTAMDMGTEAGRAAGETVAQALRELIGAVNEVAAELANRMSQPHSAALIDRIQALEAAVDNLLHGEAGEPTVTATSDEPELRVRISHAHTLKDGWRCDSTTVEWTGPQSAYADATKRIDAVLRLAWMQADAEARHRNGLHPAEPDETAA